MALEIETSKIRREMRPYLSDALRSVLDKILDYPFLTASAGGMGHRLDNREPMLLSILVRHERIIQAHKDETLRSEVSKLL